MKAAALNVLDLLRFRPEGGVMTFAGQRVLLMDAVALGLLRRQLVELLGATAARGVLARFGFSHGWRTAEALRDVLPWDTPSEWRQAGGRLHRLQGLVTFEPDPRPDVFASACWPDSYEAEQHILHLGLAPEPVCWTLCGFASGYLSYAFGEPVYCVEESCVGCGDAACRMVGRTLRDWGQEASRFVSFYAQKSLDESLEAVRQALHEAEGALQKKRMSTKGWSAEERYGLVVRSASMRRLVETARRVARVDTTVLITGESGVGKERIARLIHEESPRANRAFVAINCGAVSEELLESELFGHSRGAFTGAARERVGLFEAANGGTLFLDQVGEVSPAMQVKLLRVLQERSVRRVGENQERAVDVRLLAATNRDLLRMVERGEVRSDFYYRLSVVELCVAPLRERPEDIVPLALHFLAEVSARLHREDIQGFSRAALDSLSAHLWPGNVRELHNAVERAVALAQGTRIEDEDLWSGKHGRGTVQLGLEGEKQPSVTADVSETLAQVERRHIEAVLQACGGHKKQAAKVLGIGTATLYRKIKQWR